MTGKAMSLKAKIRNLAKEKNMSAQVVLQNFMFERFLERLSKSDYKENFILKGGMLIAAMVGIGNRSTMDMDATIKGYPVNDESLKKIITEICNIEINDNVLFSFSGIDSIRDDDVYGGFRVSIVSEFDTIRIPLQIDITIGDIITPREVMYLYKKIFEEGNIAILSYNVETILAEKIETILRRGELNTRPRDFYDVYILAKNNNYKHSLFNDAIKSTATHRNTKHIFTNINNRLEEISLSENLVLRWVKYTKDYKYAEGISFDDIINTINNLLVDFR
jgi:predicted nucleotidyltransferase component of viral defense system